MSAMGCLSRIILWWLYIARQSEEVARVLLSVLLLELHWLGDFLRLALGGERARALERRGANFVRAHAPVSVGLQQLAGVCDQDEKESERERRVGDRKRGGGRLAKRGD